MLSGMNLKKKTFFDHINYVLLFFVFFATLFPFWKILMSSLSAPIHVMKNEVFLWPKGLTLDNFKLVFSNANAILPYWNTLKYTTLGTAINITMTVSMAYALSRRRFKGRAVFMKLITFTLMFSGGLVPSFLVVNKLGLYNSLWALVLPEAVSTWNLIITWSFFKALPESLEESAIIDGANDIRVLVHIVIPISMPILATLTLFYAVAHWNSFFAPLIYLNDRDKYPLQIFLRTILIDSSVTQYASDMDTAIASQALKYTVIIATILPIVLLYPFLQKYFVQGVMIGSIKG